MSQKLKNKLRQRIKAFLGYDQYMAKRWRSSNAFADTDFELGYIFDKDKPILGIFSDIAHEHKFYIQACVEKKINYKVIQSDSNNWINDVNLSKCDIFLLWPTIYKPVQKKMWDEIIHSLVIDLNKKIFPSADLLWIYESKIRTKYWLQSKHYKYPRTHVFFNSNEALNFLEKSTFPIVLKTDQGAASSGVFILKTKANAIGMIKTAFGRGIKLKNRGSFDRHRGYVILQEYLEECEEWRIIRVGESYFCRKKLKDGDFHSGTGKIIWAKPDETLLGITKEISEHFEVPNINIDFLKSKSDEFFVNEIHALWGGKVIRDVDLEGKYVYNKNSGDWDFIRGDFFGNRCAELRIDWIRDNWL